jgi:uncharacterized protein YrrD
MKLTKTIVVGFLASVCAIIALVCAVEMFIMFLHNDTNTTRFLIEHNCFFVALESIPVLIIISIFSSLVAISVVRDYVTNKYTW